MPTTDLLQLLKANPYPGRGIALGLSPNGRDALALYFIMGRSQNSRNRVFTPSGEGIVTEAADPSKMEDPSLIIYAPVRVAGNHTIVTNGDQTDTLYDALSCGGTFTEALSSRTFEPDAPNYTPRISGLLSLELEGFGYRLSILKSAGGLGQSVQRQFFEYPQPTPGCGHFISTYAGDGSPLPSFSGEPVAFSVPEELTAFGSEVWNSLNANNKVSLFVRQLGLEGETDTQLYNRFSKA